MHHCRIIASASLVLATLGGLNIAHAEVTFSVAEKVTDTSENFQLARNPNSSIAFDSAGTLHATYWAGGAATLPSTPSYVYYQSWTEGSGWTTREFVDDSTYNPGSGDVHYGGRHSSLAVGPDDSVWITWHDHRHSNPDSPGNGIDNIEIYADSKSSGGSFSASDIRITNTSAGHLGDNGYIPSIAIAPDGVVSIFWYDFSLDGGKSDVFVKHSDTSGNFNFSETMTDMQLTDASTRPSFSDAYSVPDVAVDSSGAVYGIWTKGFGGAAPVYYAALPNPASIVSEAEIATDTGAFFNPAKIATASNNDVWVVYNDISGSTSDIYAVRKIAASSTFGSPIPLAANSGYEETAPDIEIDADGIAHIVWIDERSGRHVYYGQFDPDSSTMIEEEQLTASAGNWERPTITLDADGKAYILFEENIDGSTGDIWFTYESEPTAVGGWQNYE